MKKNEFIIIGAGGHSKVVFSTAKMCKIKVQSFYDDSIVKIGKKFLGRPVLGPLEKLKNEDFKAIIGIGDNKKRKEIAEKYPLSYFKLIHPFSYVDENVEIGEGSVVFAGSIIQPDCKIGKHVIINTGATIDHDCIIGNYAHIAPGVHICGGCKVEEGVLIGVGSSVLPNIKIGEWSIIGGHTVVAKNIPPNSILKGKYPELKEIKD